MATISPQFFDINSNKYKCLCNSLHVTIGIKIFGGFGLTLLIPFTLFIFIFPSFFTVISVYPILIESAAIGCLIMAVKSSKSNWMSPVMVIKAVNTIASISIGICIGIVTLIYSSELSYWFSNGFKDENVRDQLRNTNVGLILTVWLFLTSAFNAWFFLVARGANSFYEDQEQHQQTTNPMQPITPGPVQMVPVVGQMPGFVQQPPSYTQIQPPPTAYPPQPQAGFK